MLVSVPVAPYVLRYISHTYGTGPYDLSFNKRRNDLRIQFLWMALEADFPVKMGKVTHNVILDLGKDSQLIRFYRENSELIKSGAYFHATFMNDMKNFIEAQEMLAARLRLRHHTWNQKTALDDFLGKYEIDPAEYDFHSAYRQFSRMKSERLGPLAEKMTVDYEFCPSDNQHFRLARLWWASRKRISFWCFSRSKEDIIVREHYIPIKMIRTGNTLNYARDAIQVINTFLLKGYTIA